jgi:hypothetical protein
MLYVLILYCTGFCPASLGPQSVMFYSSLTDCKAAIGKDMWVTTFTGPGGKPMRKTHFRQNCAEMFADPEQLDRILNPEKLRKLLDDNGVKR